MCNLFANTMPVDAMRRLFETDRDALGNQPPLPAIFPRHDAPVARLNDKGFRELVRMHWGFLMPQVSKRTGKPILPKAINNARDDKVATSRFWRDSFEARRCLVPATAFCEAKGRKAATYFWFGLSGAEERPPFAFAGLWRRFRGNYRGELVEIETSTIVTNKPNALVAEVHPDRMPVILPPAAHETWLSGSPQDAFALVAPYPAEGMRIVRSGVGLTSDPLDGRSME